MPLEAFTPQKFHEYVTGMHVAPPVKSDITAGLTKAGAVTIRTKRKPKWCTKAEIAAWSQALGKPINEVWNYCTKSKFLIFPTVEEAKEATKQVAELQEVWPAEEKEEADDSE